MHPPWPNPPRQIQEEIIVNVMTPPYPPDTNEQYPDEFAAAPDQALPGDAAAGVPETPLVENPEPPTPPPPYGGFPPFGSTLRRLPRPRVSVVLVTAVLLSLLVGGVAGSLITRGAIMSGNTLVVGATSAPAITVSSSTASLQHDVEQVAAAVTPSVVKVTGTALNGTSIGSGDILTANGYIVTNDHVVVGASSFTVTLSSGKSYGATLVGQDAQDDLAVLKINATGLTPIALADSSKVTVGTFVVAIGNPLGLQEAASFGTVSGVNGTASEAPNGPAGTLTGLIQTTAPIAPGNSGGALVNLQGQLIGIPTLEVTNPDTRSASGFGYAIPSNRVQYVATQIIQHGQLVSSGQGFIGIQAQDVTPQIAAANGLSVQSGVLVAGFANDAAGQSPAQQAGLQTGDIIVAVNGQAIASGSDLSSALLNRAPGTQVTVTVVRGSSQLTVTITLGERPAGS
jgi:S1-C subfamily serine protease